MELQQSWRAVDEQPGAAVAKMIAVWAVRSTGCRVRRNRRTDDRQSQHAKNDVPPCGRWTQAITSKQRTPGVD